MLYSIVTAVVTLLLVARLKEKVLYILFPWAYVQNVVLAWMYTSGFAGKDLCRALLLSKELILLWLFFYFVPGLRRYGRGHWPRPVLILGLFTGWCIARYAASVVIQGESLSGNLWNLRVACFPFEILVAAIGVAATKPEFAQRFIRAMTYVVSGLAVVGILLYLLPGTGFWRAYADFATYEVEVKGQSEGYSNEPQEQMAQQEGISGNGVARGAFSQLSPFRAFGTVGDAVGFGHFLAFPILLAAFVLRRSWWTRVMLVVMGSALLFSFTRSAWMVAALGCLYVLMRKKRYRLLLALGGAAAAFAILAPIDESYSSSLDLISWANKQDYHAQGVLWLYKEGLWNLNNVLGQGMTGSIGMSGDLPESGYGVLLIWYGLPAVLGITWFCFSMQRALRTNRQSDKPLFLVAQALPSVLLVTMNFSYYPFSFIPYLLPWFVVGTCVAIAASKSAVVQTVGQAAPRDGLRFVINPEQPQGGLA